MSLTNTSLCVFGHTVRVAKYQGVDFCLCATAYRGEYCELEHSFYRPFVIICTILRFITMLYIAFWAILKTAQLVKTGAFRIKKLSVISLLLILIGSLIRFTYDLIYLVHPNSITGTLDLPRVIPELDGFLSGLVTMVIVFYMPATSLILGFWFDVLQKKLRPTIAARTKIVAITGAVLVLIALPGLILNVRGILAPLGAILVITPLVINIVGMLVMLIAIGCMKGSLKKLAEANRRKQRYAIRVTAVAVTFWVFYLVGVGLFAPAAATSPSQKETAALFIIPAMLIDLISQFVIGMCVMFLVDRHGGLIAQVRFNFCGVVFTETKTNRGSISAKNSDAKLASEDSTGTNSTTGTTSNKSSKSAPASTASKSSSASFVEEDSK